MAKKTVSTDETRKKEARFMIDTFNQYVKNLSSLVYLGSNGDVYLKQEDSLRYGFLLGTQYPIDYMYVLYDTLKLAEFRKEFRISGAEVSSTKDGVVISHNSKAKYPNARFEFNRACDPESNYETIQEMEKMIKYDFYKKPELAFYDSMQEWIEVTEDELHRLENADLVTFEAISPVTNREVHIDVTKAIFPLVAKTTKMKYRAIEYQNGRDNQIAYFEFSEFFEEIKLFVNTIRAAYQSI